MRGFTFITIYVLLLLAVFFMLMAQGAKAECSKSVEIETVQTMTKAPKALEGALIEVTTTSGARYRMDASEYMVVKRTQKRELTKTTVTCESKRKLNRVSVLGGQGPQAGLKTTRPNPGEAEVRTQVGLVLGAQYSRQVNDTVSIGVQVQDNETAMSVLGFEF